jgi:hypothetical protein
MVTLFVAIVRPLRYVEAWSEGCKFWLVHSTSPLLTFIVVGARLPTLGLPTPRVGVGLSILDSHRLPSTPNRLQAPIPPAPVRTHCEECLHPRFLL